MYYLLTVMKNTKMQKDKRIIWKGNFPKNDKLEKFLKESGFLNYMRTAEQNLIHSDENIQMIKLNIHLWIMELEYQLQY